MRMSSSFVAPSAVAILSAAFLCGPSGPAMSQTELPKITVVAPKQAAKPQRPERVAPRRTSSAAHRPTAQASSATTEAIMAGPDSPLGKLAKLERLSSSCNGGCATSFKTGNAPWVGCSESGGFYSTFSATCRDTLTYASYRGCMDTKMFTERPLRQKRSLVRSMSALPRHPTNRRQRTRALGRHAPIPIMGQRIRPDGNIGGKR